MEELVNISNLPGRICSYEISIKLLELGFNEECNYSYNSHKELVLYNSEYLKAPYLWDLLIYLENKYNIYVNFDPVFTYSLRSRLGWSFKIFTIDMEFYSNKNDALEESISKILEIL